MLCTVCVCYQDFLVFVHVWVPKTRFGQILYWYIQQYEYTVHNYMVPLTFSLRKEHTNLH